MQGNTQHSDGTDGLGRRYNVGDPLRHHSIPATSVGMQSDGFLVPAIVVWLAVLVLWRGALSAGFVFDDIVRIVGEERFIVAPWTSWQAVAVGQRPLVQLSLGLNHALGGLNPWGYHAFNILVHATDLRTCILQWRGIGYTQSSASIACGVGKNTAYHSKRYQRTCCCPKDQMQQPSTAQSGKERTTQNKCIDC